MARKRTVKRKTKGRRTRDKRTKVKRTRSLKRNKNRSKCGRGGVLRMKRNDRRNAQLEERWKKEAATKIPAKTRGKQSRKVLHEAAAKEAAAKVAPPSLPAKKSFLRRFANLGNLGNLVSRISRKKSTPPSPPPTRKIGPNTKKEIVINAFNAGVNSVIKAAENIQVESAKMK